jgi:pimeloyl-ACP methyl ester carboxylesterase
VGAVAARRHVVVDGLRCHYLEAGDGPPLVLLHGTAIDSAQLSFGPSITVFARHHRVLALDWPGYGTSEMPRLALSVADHVDLLESFLDRVDTGPAHVAGFSMGGAVALGLAARAAARVRTLTLIGSYGLDATVPVPVLPYLAMRMPRLRQSVVWGLRRSRLLTRLILQHVVFANGALVTPELVRDVHEQLRAPEAERSFVAWLRGELRPFGYGTSYADELERITVPTLLMHGQRDRVISARKAVRAHERMPASSLRVVPGCGHWVMREAPDTFRKELAGWTRRQWPHSVR